MEGNKKIVIYTDGGARGNPGPAAIACVIELPQQKKSYSEYIGETTNNVAEYKALILAFRKTKQLLKIIEHKNAEIEVRSDSELVVRQLKGEYKVKDSNLKVLFEETKNLMQSFKKVTFAHIPREKNAEADKLVNLTLDKN